MYQQPPTGYNQQYYPPPGYHYPPPNYYQQVNYPPPVTARPANGGMKATAIILFVVGFVLNIIALVPFVGSFFGLFGLLCDFIAFVCLCLI